MIRASKPEGKSQVLWARGCAEWIHRATHAVRVRRMARETSMKAEQDDGIRVWELAERLREDPPPRRPR